jgi:hypothetical protein
MDYSVSIWKSEEGWCVSNTTTDKVFVFPMLGPALKLVKKMLVSKQVAEVLVESEGE